MQKHKKGVLENIAGLFISLAIIGVVAVISFLILGQVGANTTVAADANATAAMNTITDAADDIPGWIPLVVVVTIGGLMIYLIMRFKGR